MAKTYDLAIIGSGTAATVAAARVRAAGWSVALVDWRPYGGTCALRGCDPKKVLVGAAAAVDHARRLRSKGVKGEAGIDWAELMRFKRGFTDPVPESRAADYARQGIDAYRGRARFTGPQALQVGEDALDARHVLIAAGAEPVPTGIDGEEHLVSSEQFLALDSLPRRIALVGGGYIAAEFSQLAARAGAQVTVLQRGERMLAAFDPDLVAWLMERFRALDIDVRTSTEVRAIEQAGESFRVHAVTGGTPVTVETDLVLHAAGRAPPLAELDLPAGQVAAEAGRLKLNDYLQSESNTAVYAAGDSARSGPPLTPVAAHDAKVVAANLLQGNHRKPDYRGVPTVAFTVPPIAAVGLSEAGARLQGLKFRVHSRKASDWYTARQAAQPGYGFKLLVEDGSDRILGAHLLGPQADEVINLFALAIRHGLTAPGLKATLFAYPTGASDIAYMLA